MGFWHTQGVLPKAKTHAFWERQRALSFGCLVGVDK